MNFIKSNSRITGGVALILFFAVSFFFQSCTDGKGEGKPIPKLKEPIPVKVIKVVKTIGSSTIQASGQLTTDNETVLGFKIGGIVRSVYVNAGDQVKKGQLLAILDETEINAGVEQARLGVEKAKRDFNRIDNLYRDSVATLEQLQNMKTALLVAQEQLASVVFNKSHASIYAQENGVVLKKFVNEGQVVGIGDPILIVNDAAHGDWILKVGVSDRQWAAIKNGDKATVLIDAFPEKKLTATVIRKSGTSDPYSGAFTIELKLDQPVVELASGMFGSSAIYSGEELHSWAVPYDAVLDANGSEAFVFIATENGIAKKKPVVIESFNEREVRISKGLDEGNSLIVSGSAYLNDSSLIKIIQ